MGQSGESSLTYSGRPLLIESQRVLDQQVQIVQNQQQQATKIIRVLLTITGLLLTFSSIAATLISSGTLAGLGISDVSLALPELSPTSAVAGIFGFYLLTLLVASVGLMFVSAFKVLSPDTTSTGLSIIQFVMNFPVIGTAFEFYFRILPLSYNPLESISERKQVSLRPGIDGEKARELSKIDDATHRLNEIIEYNSGCIEMNGHLVEQNRRLLSVIYSTAIVFTVAMGVIIVLSALFFIL